MTVWVGSTLNHSVFTAGLQAPVIAKTLYYTPISSAKVITSFAFLTLSVAGIITGTNIAVTVPAGTNVTALVPTIVHTGSSVSPASGIAQNFTSPVTYTVTAADATTQAFVVTVSLAAATIKPISGFNPGWSG